MQTETIKKARKKMNCLQQLIHKMALINNSIHLHKTKNLQEMTDQLTCGTESFPFLCNAKHRT